jgi:hypothetical protein
VKLPSACLVIAIVTYAKKCLIFEVPSAIDIYTGFNERSSTVQSPKYPTELLVETVGTAVTVPQNVRSKVSSLG